MQNDDGWDDKKRKEVKKYFGIRDPWSDPIFTRDKDHAEQTVRTVNAPWLHPTFDIPIPVQIILHDLREIKEDELERTRKLMPGPALTKLKEVEEALANYETLLIKTMEIIELMRNGPYEGFKHFNDMTDFRNYLCDQISFYSHWIYAIKERNDNGS